MHTQKVLIYTCALVTSASALFISHNVRQDSEEFIRQSANIVESPWRLVAVPPVSVPIFLRMFIQMNWHWPIQTKRRAFTNGSMRMAPCITRICRRVRNWAGRLLK
jgi:hypothetical protein